MTRYNDTSPNATAWLNPIRLAHVDALVRHVEFKGGKLLLDENGIRATADNLGLTTHQWWIAANDGHTNKRLSVRHAGRLVAVELRAPEPARSRRWRENPTGNGRGAWR